MKDKSPDVIYVGKANNLKTRVLSYFRPSNPDPKAQVLASAVKNIEYILTDSEVEALVLENNLIKRYSPKYNVMLKDSKTYPYIKLTVTEDYPRLFLTRKLTRDGSKYYGPYLPVFSARELMNTIRKIWHIRQCAKTLPRDIGKGRPCLNYHIGECKAPCMGYISKHEYHESVSDVQTFLSGGYDKLIKEMESRMMKFADELKFEQAARLRDSIETIRVLSDKQKADSKSTDDRDYIAFAHGKDMVLFYIFFMRGGKINGNESCTLSAAHTHEFAPAREEIMSAFIKQFYSQARFIPPAIITQIAPADKELIETYLGGLQRNSVTISTPQKGEKLKVIQLAAKNAALLLEQTEKKKKQSDDAVSAALNELKEILNLTELPHIIEAFDISNIQGVYNTGSMVVFIDALPSRNDYRKFRCRTNKANDYACMEEIIGRRFARFMDTNRQTETTLSTVTTNSFSAKPNLVLVDGGAGQVTAAKRAISTICSVFCNDTIKDIPICGLVKDDNHRTRALIYEGHELILPKRSACFMLLTRIQDEMHRFAYEYHKTLHVNSMTASELDSIKGIGEARKNALLTHFKGLNKIKEATIETLAAVPGMNKRTAESVYEHFHNITDNV